MFKSFLKYILPKKIVNLILKIYIKASLFFSPYKTSQSFWNSNTVDSPKGGFNNVDDSQNDHRNLKHVLGNILFNESSSSNDENEETSRCVPTYVVVEREFQSVFHEIISLEYYYNSCCKRF